MKKGTIILLAVVAVVVIGGIYYNKFVTLEEGVNQKWAQVENVYQRRADLIPNLVEVVKGYAAHERETLDAVTEARSRVGGQINVGPEVLNDPAAFARFQQAQTDLSSALQRLMVVVEAYPNLKADQRFADLQSQLEGTENRISVERGRFIEDVQKFNVAVRRFPGNLFSTILGFKEKLYFKSEPGSEKVPQVKF